VALAGGKLRGMAQSYEYASLILPSHKAFIARQGTKDAMRQPKKQKAENEKKEPHENHKTKHDENKFYSAV
jgi:hypothetical protein